jgi:hypothetical protein
MKKTPKTHEGLQWHFELLYSPGATCYKRRFVSVSR